MSDQKKSGFPLVLIILILLLCGGAWAYTQNPDILPLKTLLQTQGITASEEQEENDIAADATEKATTSVPAMTALASTEDMLTERILGFPNAPIKVSEHSSFTCSHCGDFHRNTYAEFRREYIVTGKAYLVFSDFPLNAPALYASMVTRCIPEENYFDMVQTLFEKQDEWAYEVSYMDFLKEEAAKYGLTEDLFKECVENTDLRQGLLSKMQQKQTEHNVRSTPTFVINDIGHISGSLPFEQFKSALEAAIAPVAPALAPATEVDTPAVVPPEAE